jgi:hypothetical protein
LTLDDVLKKGRKMVEVDRVPIPVVVDLISTCLKETGKNRTRSEHEGREAYTKVVIETFLAGFIYSLLQPYGSPKVIEGMVRGSELYWIIGVPAVSEVVTKDGTTVFTFGFDLWKSYTKGFEDGWKEILSQDDFFKRLFDEVGESIPPSVSLPNDTVFRDDRPRTRQIVDPKINPRRLNPLFRTENPYIGDRKDNSDEVNVRVKRKPVNRKKSVSRVACR